MKNLSSLNEEELIALIKSNTDSKNALGILIEKNRDYIQSYIRRNFSDVKQVDKQAFIDDLTNDYIEHIINRKLIENYEPLKMSFKSYLLQYAWYFVMDSVFNSSKGKFETFSIINMPDSKEEIYGFQPSHWKAIEENEINEARNIEDEQIRFLIQNNFQAKYLKRKEIFSNIHREFIEPNKTYRRNSTQNLTELIGGITSDPHILRKEIMANVFSSIKKKKEE